MPAEHQPSDDPFRLDPEFVKACETTLAACGEAAVRIAEAYRIAVIEPIRQWVIETSRALDAAQTDATAREDVTHG